MNIIWNTPSRDSSGSMPLGNGDIGLNVWVEEDGDLLFYLGKTDAWDENARLLKLGRVRVSLTPNPFRAGAAFRQELDTATGSIRIAVNATTSGEGAASTVDATPPARGGISGSGEGAASTVNATSVHATALPHYFDPHESIGHVAGGNLPHWRQDGATYFVTFRTADSMPRERVEEWACERDAWLKEHPEPHDEATRLEYHCLFTERWQDWLDESHGACLLARAEIAREIERCLRHDDGTAYRLGDFVVMPNHVHALVTPIGAHTLSTILQAWKSVTAHAIGRMGGGKVAFWQKESFDHIVRNAEQHARIQEYIKENPRRQRRASGEGAASTVNATPPSRWAFTVDATPPSRGGLSGEGAAFTVDAVCSILIWVDANRPVVRVEIDSLTPIDMRASVELWRTAERSREGRESHCDAGLRSPQESERVYPDTVVPLAEDALVWCHRNRISCWAATLEHQDMATWIAQGRDPLINRTFGALLRGEGFVKDGDCALHTATPLSRIVVSVHPLTAQTATLDEWVAAALAQAARSDTVALESAFVGHSAWWRAFRERSWIRVSGTPEADVVSRGYELQRYINACGGRGAFPIKFNGSIFTVDAREKDEVFDADYRRWGGGYWFQNTRLTYWSMLMSGDFDLMEPWFRMYLDALPFAIARAKACFGIENAAMFPETMTFWGSFLNENYGFNRSGLQPGITENAYIRRYWQGMLELLTVLLDTYAVTGDESLLQDKLLVLAPPFLRFYREYYPRRDDDGKILLKPSQSLETWHDAVNPLPDIAGLQWVLDGLLALPEASVPGVLRAEWAEFRRLLPPLPTRSFFWEKRKELIPALQYDDCKNSENVTLYAVFPYRLFGVGKPELEVGRATWAGRQVKDTGGWRQDAIQAALLGLTDEAKAALVSNFSTSHAGSRFPAFWGPNFDWVPDQDHGSVACLALQRMVLQADGGRIQLLPAWPKDWNVEFKLHTHNQTVVEGCWREGKLEALTVLPAERRKDVISI